MKIRVLVLILAGAPCWATAAEDACRAQLPASLVSVLNHEFATARLPLVSDNLEEDIKFNKSRGGSGCLGVASGDFDGNGEKDFAVGLTPPKGPPIVVVALANKGAWTLRAINSWVDNRNRLYVDVAPPGRFKRTPAAEGPLRPSERKSMICAHEGVVVGATESTGIVYCLIKDTWFYVWVSD
jgi:hypothetical protein